MQSEADETVLNCYTSMAKLQL